VKLQQKILLLAATTGYQTRSLTEAARRQGVEVLLATDRCHIMEDPWGDHAIPVRFEEPEALDVKVDGIVAVADKPTLIAALTAEKIGIPWHPPEAAANCRDKSRSRAAFERAGLPTPWHFIAKPESQPDFPCVLKPLGLSASRGVIRANNQSEYVAAYERIRKILGGDGPIQVEQYIPGREFALEGLMTHGELTVLAIFDKPDPLEGPFFEETIYLTPSRESQESQQAIIDTTCHAVQAVGLTHGPIHAEMRVNETGVYMLEIAARPIGGLCARSLRFSNNLSLEDVIVLHAVNRMPADLTRAIPSSGVMMIPIPRGGIYDRVQGLENARAIPNIDDIVITAKQGQKLVQLPEGASYLGFIFASGDTPAAVETALRTAHAALKFDINATLNVVPF
jgi:formate-dependent phosphoribosylglycinamide formyltransferase (GAR transformylase)